LAFIGQRILGRGAWLRSAPGPLGRWARARELPRLAPRPLRDLVNRR
jgi:hypothetical protein